MRLAIFSDIHSNLEAFQACCRRASDCGVEAFVCLGDITGYGANPRATLDLLMSLPGLIAVRGNHDAALLSGFEAAVRGPVEQATAWTRRQLTERQLAFLSELPYQCVAFGATFAHASLAAPERWEYLFAAEQIRPTMEAAGTDIVFLGHIHMPKVYYEPSSGAIRELHPQAEVTIPLHHNRSYVINVGSVGQPRDGNNAACFVLYDTEAREIVYQRVGYNYSRAARKILDAELDPVFADRLATGS